MAAALINITGNVTKDPVITFRNKKKATFTVAVNRKENEAMFYRVTAWDYDAEKVEKYIKKGYELTVSGEFWPNSYTDKNNVSRVSYDVTADNIQFRRKSRSSSKSEILEEKGETRKEKKGNKKEIQYSPIEETDLANGDFEEYF